MRENQEKNYGVCSLVEQSTELLTNYYYIDVYVTTVIIHDFASLNTATHGTYVTSYRGTNE